MTTVLISGAGVAGPTLAYWLARYGFQPTVVERSAGLRSSGNPVDVRGPALPVVEQMGVIPQLNEVSTQATGMQIVNGPRVPMPASRSAAGTPEVEVPRADLATVLYRAARDHADFLFDDTITGFQQDEGGVDVTFDRAAPRRFDLVIGADGLHSTVRRLGFGPEHDSIRHLGIYVATLPLGRPADEPDDILLYNTPGRMVSIHPARGEALAAFIFRGAPIAGFDHRDTAQHKRIVSAAYARAGWRVPELLDAVVKADDLYFDAVSMVRLDCWSRGRVALLGDAASCVSLFGDGSSSAIAGAFTLAEALAQNANYADAYRRYEAQHRAVVAPKQRAVRLAGALLVPKTQLGIGVRNTGARLWFR